MSLYLICPRKSLYGIVGSLELKNLLLRVSQFLQNAIELALVLWTLLRPRQSLVQTRRPTHKHLHVLRVARRQDRLEQLLVDEAFSLLPARRGIVQHIEGAESLREVLLELVEFGLQQDVFLGHVAEHERHLRLVQGIVEDSSCKLIHGCHSSAACNQRNVVVLVRRPRVLGNRALDLECVAGLHVMQMCRHGTSLVLLHQQIHMSPISFI